MNKLMLLLPLLCVLAADATAAAAKPVVTVAKVRVAEDMESRRYTGRVVSRAVVQIVPRVSGEITAIGFADGAVVKAGQMLYKLDPVQYEATVKSAEAKITECRAKLEYAENNYERNHLLFEKNAASRDTMENTKSSLNAFQAALLAAEAELITARDNLKNCTIIAPMEGVVGVTNYTIGNYLTPNSGVLISIIQVRPIRVVFSISTADYLAMFGSFKELQQNGVVRLRLSDGTEYPVTGTIELINNEANSKTDAIQVFAAFPNADLKLIVGSTVNVTLTKKLGRKVPAVLLSAVMHDARGAYVYTVGAEDKISRQPVVAGNATTELQMIESGLTPGQRVVVKGTHKVRPGDAIEAVNE